MTLHHGDGLDVLRTLPANSVDACVTDPPYGLSFMGKRWDYDVPSTEVWAEVLRVLKPGGHLLCFAGTRTQHRMAVRIEDAGFEIRDMLAWVYGSGFPKSLNLGTGWGTALKPALEPITLARKPLIGTVAANVQQWGTGAINVDGCRVATGDALSFGSRAIGDGVKYGRMPQDRMTPGVQHAAGRWPANLLHDGSDEVVGLFPQSASGSGGRLDSSASTGFVNVGGGPQSVHGFKPHPDAGVGSAARFFYCAKASKRDRDEGLEGFAEVRRTDGRQTEHHVPNLRTTSRANHHPTVKPTTLMRYLVRLVTPPGGTVLDPFMGSGSTGKACALEGFAFVGIEREAEYLDIARARIAHAVEDERAEAEREPRLPLGATA